jgi:hypothetical protein
MSRAKNEKGKSKVSIGEAASRVGMQVYHTGQGQDERADTRPSHLLRGLDSAWSGASNPHRESGTRWWAAADVGAAGRGTGTAHVRQKGRGGNRLGDWPISAILTKRYDVPYNCG